MKYECTVMSAYGRLCAYWPGMSMQEIHERAKRDDPVWRFQKPRFRPLTAERKSRYLPMFNGDELGQGIRCEVSR